MTKFLLTFWLLMVAGNSVAQTFACQYVADTGFRWEHGSWVSTTFKTGKPFFIGLNSDGKTINTKTIEKMLPNATCSGDEYMSMCHGSVGRFLSFSLAGEKGAYVETLGSMMRDDLLKKDDISIAPFTCQKM